jgi:hypothetical protein
VLATTPAVAPSQSQLKSTETEKARWTEKEVTTDTRMSGFSCFLTSGLNLLVIHDQVTASVTF